MPEKEKSEYESLFKLGDKVGYTTVEFFNQALVKAYEDRKAKKRTVTFDEILAYVPQYSYGVIDGIVIGRYGVLYNIRDQFDFHLERNVPAERMKFAPKPNQ